MDTYTALDGHVLDVSRLDEQEAAFLDRLLQLYRDGRTGWHDIANIVTGPDNPSLEPGARVTAAVQARPLYRAARDIEDRVGIRDGKLRPGPDDDVDTDPTADTSVTVAEAAKARAVSPRAIYSAVERGELVSPAGPGPARISARSLARWAPNEIRRAAGKKRSTVLMERLEDSIHDARTGDAFAKSQGVRRNPGAKAG